MENGYFAILGCQFNSSVDAIAKGYKRAVVRWHPDRNRGNELEAQQKFQLVKIAHGALTDPIQREAYMRVLELRHYANQSIDAAGLVDPFVCFAVEKSADRGKSQERLIKINFMTREFSNWDKDELKKTFSFDDLDGVVTSLSEPLDLSIRVKSNNKLYDYHTPTASERDSLVLLFQGILSKTLSIKNDDAQLPPGSVRKGKVEKRGASFTYAIRWLILGTASILIFRDEKFEHLVNILLFAPGCSCARDSDTCFIITCNDSTFVFKVSSEAECSEWVNDLKSAIAKRLATYSSSAQRLTNELHSGAHAQITTTPARGTASVAASVSSAPTLKSTPEPAGRSRVSTILTGVYSNTGHFSSLNLTLDCDFEANKTKAYKRLLVRNDPDPQALLPWQILSNDQSRVGYLYMLQIRCYANQVVDVDSMVDPFVCFAVDKNGEKRLLKFDLIKREFSNWDKDEMKKRFDFSDIQSVTAVNPFELQIFMKSNGKTYDFRTRTEQEQRALFLVFQGIVGNSLVVKLDDNELPSPFIASVIVSRKKSSLFGWAGRKLVLGFSMILLFRVRAFDTSLTDVLLLTDDLLLNADGTSLTISTEKSGVLHLLKFETQDACSGWATLIRQVQAGSCSYAVVSSESDTMFSFEYMHNLGVQLSSMDPSADHDDHSPPHSPTNASSFVPTDVGTLNHLIEQSLQRTASAVPEVTRPLVPEVTRPGHTRGPSVAAAISEPGHTRGPSVAAAIVSGGSSVNGGKVAALETDLARVSESIRKNRAEYETLCIEKEQIEEKIASAKKPMSGKFSFF